MQKQFTFLLSFILMWGFSHQVIISPCKVENIVTQPHSGTSLSRRELVRVVQIPPVFTQNVIVGRCINATSELEGSLTAGSYFVCKQRYSSVEVYILDEIAEGSGQNSSGSVYGILDKLRTSNFVKEFVVVESGCDFNFNLLPILRQQQELRYPKPRVTTGSVPHVFHFLKSPYYPTEPEHLTGSTKQHLVQDLINTNSHQYTQPQGISQTYPTTSSNTHQYSQPEPQGNAQTHTFPANLHQNLQSEPQGIVQNYPATPNSNQYSQPEPQGNAQTHTFSPNLHQYLQSEPQGIVQNYPATPNSNQYSQPQGITQIYSPTTSQPTHVSYPKGGTNDVYSAGTAGQDNTEVLHHHTTHIDTEPPGLTPLPNYIPPPTGSYGGDPIRNSEPPSYVPRNYEYSTTEPKPEEAELYGISNTVGVPLYILSPRIDPLINNIENHFSVN